MNSRTSQSTSGERKEVGRNGNKAIGKKIYKCKKSYAIKTNKTKLQWLKNSKRKEKKKRGEREKRLLLLLLLLPLLALLHPKTFDLRTVNGRVNGDTLGRPTFHGKNGTSVIDSLICDQCTFLNVGNFDVKQPSYLSDHSAIVAWLNLSTSLIEDETHPPNSSNRLVTLNIDNGLDNDDASQPRQTGPRVTFSAGKTKFKRWSFPDRRRLFLFSFVLLHSCYGIQGPQ